MQIAVAGMKHIGDAQAVFRRHLLHAVQHQRQLRARNGAVHAVIVRRDAADRRERRLAAGPEQQPLVLGIGHAASYRAAALGDVLHALEQMIDLILRTIELDDQQGLDVERIAGMDELLGGGDGGTVHHFHAAGNDAGADDPGDAFAAVLGSRKTDQRRARGLRFLQNANGDFGNDAKQPLGSGDNAEQIVAAGIEMLAAESQNFAGHQHEFAAEHVVGGHAVFEAMHAAGIFRDIAADGAGDLRRRIGRVIEAGLGDRLRHREIGDAGLDHGDAIVEIDLADAVELGEPEQHAIAERQRAAGQRRAGAARHNLDAFAMAIAEHGGDLRGGLRQHHNHRQLAIGGEPIALVRPHGLFGRDDALARHDAPERRHDVGTALEHRIVEQWHQKRHRNLGYALPCIIAEKAPVMRVSIWLRIRRQPCRRWQLTRRTGLA